MSVFATLDNFKAHLGASVADPIGIYDQVTDRIGAVTANDTVGQEIVDQAEGEVRDWLAGRYALPTETPTDPPLARSLKTFTLDIAAYRAFEAHPSMKRVPDRWQRAYDNTVKRLQAIVDGTANLPGASPLPQPAGGPSPKVSGHTRIFTEGAMEGL